MGAEFGDYRGLCWDFSQGANAVVVLEHGAKKNLKKKRKERPTKTAALSTMKAT